jgi:hypothetical protein
MKPIRFIRSGCRRATGSSVKAIAVSLREGARDDYNTIRGSYRGDDD